MKTQTFTFPLFSVVTIFTVLLTAALGLADTEVRGAISQDTRWTVDKSPYLATGSLIVKVGVTLTIDPGVTVKFKPNTALQVDGTLVARGTEAMPITFTASEGTSPGSWGYLLFTPTSTPTELDGNGNYVKGCLLEYAVIEYAGGISDIGAAVRVNASNLLVDHCTIRHSTRRGVWVDSGKASVIRNITINNNKNTGIYVGGTATITNTTITGNTASSGGGIYVSGGTVTISNNTITGNTASSNGGGIHVDSGTATLTNNTLTGNTASSKGGGIFIFVSGTVTIANNIITGNTASSSGGGIYKYGIGTVTLTNNTITGNTASDHGGGIYQSGGMMTLTNNTITGNTASSNGGGISVDDTATITNNIITGNTAPRGTAAYWVDTIQDFSGNTVIDNKAPVGSTNTSAIYIQSVPKQFKNNTISNNQTDFDIFYAVPKGTDMDATGNYWGTTDEAKIGARIYDFFVDAGKGIVNFVPFLTAPGGPSAPTGLTLTVLDASSVRLTWNANPEPDVAGYKVYYDTNPGAPYEGKGAKEGNSPIDVKKVTSFTVSGLKTDATSYFVVTAYYADGTESGFSTEVRSNSPPKPPSNLAPVAGAKEISLTPTLECAPFVDPDAGDSHKASQWQLTATAGNYATPVYDSGVDTKNLTRLTLAAGKLNAGTIYYWRVRHQDSHGNWSEYSTETQFTTASSPPLVGKFTVPLAEGLNMISLPLKPETPYTARTFADELDATVVIRLNAETQQFDPYIPGFSKGDGFPLEGGQGYIVNVLAAGQIVFTGQMWNNAPPNPSPLPSPKRRGEFGPIWAFAVAGQVLPVGQAASLPYKVIVTNPRTGWQATQTLSPIDGAFALAVADMTRRPVVEVGDTLALHVRDAAGHSLQTISVPITETELRQARVILPPLTVQTRPAVSRLLQNFPNPFNPETWIPFQLAQAASVEIEIYTPNGHLIRRLDLGYRAAGWHLTKGSAAYWDGRNSTGEKVGSGVYFYRLCAGDFSAQRKLVVAK